MNSTKIVGTYLEFEVGKIYPSKTIIEWGISNIVSIKVLRECTEQEWRDHHSWQGPLYDNPDNKQARFYEVQALD